MRGDLEKARQAVIEAAKAYINPHVNKENWQLFGKLYDAIHALEAIERQSRPSDGGRLNADSIGGENV